MSEINYRPLALNEADRINEINPEQYIKRAWREVNGKRQLVDLNYHEKSWPDSYEHYRDGLKNTIEGNGCAIGAFDKQGMLIGYITVNRPLFGKKYKYVLLDSLFVSKECRSQGIGKKLFQLGVDEAKLWGAEKLYICAGSAEDTIAFYYTLGCEEAKEIDKVLYESDPRDLQLEFEL